MGGKYKTHLKLINKEFVSKYGEKFKVIDYENNEEVTIQYEDGTIVKTRSVNIRNGFPPNPNRPVIYGKGYHGIGDFQISINGVKTIAYVKWHGMLCRVYDGNNLYDKPSTVCYRGVSVSKDWLNFQNFAKWYYSQLNLYGENFNLCLDKDLLDYKSRQYSEETCCLLPYELNIAIQVGKTNVYFAHKQQRWVSRLTIKGKRSAKHLGKFKTKEEALESYFKGKDAHIKHLAGVYKDFLPASVYNALLNFNSKEIYEYQSV